MSKQSKIITNKAALKKYHDAGLGSQSAYVAFKEAGGKWRKQDFLAAYRMIGGTTKASYNIGGAKRAGVKKPKVEKYEKKRERKRAKDAALPARKPAKPRSQARKEKEKRHKKGKGGGGGAQVGKGYKIGAIDVTASTLGKPVDYKELMDDLKAHGIRVWDEDGGQVLHVAKSGDTVHVYGTAIYEPDNDDGGIAFGVAGSLISKIKREL